MTLSCDRWSIMCKMQKNVGTSNKKNRVIDHSLRDTVCSAHAASCVNNLILSVSAEDNETTCCVYANYSRKGQSKFANAHKEDFDVLEHCVSCLTAVLLLVRGCEGECRSPFFGMRDAYCIHQSPRLVSPY